MKVWSGAFRGVLVGTELLGLSQFESCDGGDKDKVIGSIQLYYYPMYTTCNS